MDDLYDTVLANIQLVVGSAALTEESQDVQLVYEAYSYVSGIPYTHPSFHPATSGRPPCAVPIGTLCHSPLPTCPLHNAGLCRSQLQCQKD